MANSTHQLNFSMNPNNLYREENYTDMKIGNIRLMVPVHADGTKDDSRAEVYIGSAHLMSPEGPLPIQTNLPAGTLEEAIKVFADAMETATQRMIAHIDNMKAAQ